jgi:type I restriction enzyme R subunit
MDASALYEPPFTKFHAGGPEALFEGKDGIINALFQTLKSLQPQIHGLAT